MQESGNSTSIIYSVYYTGSSEGMAKVERFFTGINFPKEWVFTGHLGSELATNLSSNVLLCSGWLPEVDNCITPSQQKHPLCVSACEDQNLFCL